MRVWTRLACAATLFAACCLVSSAQEGEAEAPKKLPADAPPAKGADEETQKVAGLELLVVVGDKAESLASASVDVEEKYVTIKARAAKWKLPSPDGKGTVDAELRLERVQWLVVTVGKKKAKVTEEIDAANSTVIVGLPGEGESLFVYAVASVTRNVERELDVAGSEKKVRAKVPETRVTRHALVVIAAEAGAGRPAPADAPERAAAIPGSVTGLHAILIADVAAAEGKALKESQTLRAALAKSKSKFYADSPTSRVGSRADIAKLARDAGVPCLIVISGDGKTVYPDGKAVPLTLVKASEAEFAKKNEVIVLDAVARAVGGR